MQSSRPCFDRTSTAAEVVAASDCAGARIVLTGASSGMGVEAAAALGLAGADLVLGVRDPARAEDVAIRIVDGGGPRPRILPLDLADPESVTRFSAAVVGPIDVLIANAGVSKTPDAHLANGLDVRFATNHLGHFVLAHQLRPSFATRGARIVVVSSAAHKYARLDLDDLQFTRRSHDDGMAYAASKVANILFAQELSRRWGADGIRANAVLPGSALTGLQRYHGEALKRRIGFYREDGSVDPMVKSAAQAAATIVWAATAPELDGRGGLVLEDCAEAEIAGPDSHPWSGFEPEVADPEIARRLWDYSADLMRSFVGPAGL